MRVAGRAMWIFPTQGPPSSVKLLMPKIESTVTTGLRQQVSNLDGWSGVNVVQDMQDWTNLFAKPNGRSLIYKTKGNHRLGELFPPIILSMLKSNREVGNSVERKLSFKSVYLWEVKWKGIYNGGLDMRIKPAHPIFTGRWLDLHKYVFPNDLDFVWICNNPLV